MTTKVKKLLLALCIAVLLPTITLAEITWNNNACIVSSASELSEAITYVNNASGGEYIIKLGADFTAPGISLRKNTATILGEKHTLSTDYSSVFYVESGATLNLGQEGYTQSLTISGSPKQDRAMGGPLVYGWGSTAVLNMYDHVVLKDNSSTGPSGGVAMINSATFNMYGGTIENCRAPGFSGGGVFIDGGTFDMTNGTITNCSASCGGGIYSQNGVISISDSTITFNSSTAYGGGIYSENDTLTITNSNISSNKTTNYYGGGIFSYGEKLSISGSHVLNNSAPYGGGITLYNSRTPVPLKNCTIAQNTAQSGGGILLMKSSSMDLSGAGNKVFNNTASAEGADIFIYSSSDTLLLFPAEEMNQTYLDTGKKIDGWYSDKANNRYTPTTDAQSIDVSQSLSGYKSLVASYRLLPKYSLTFKPANGNADTSLDVEAGSSVEAPSAPVRDGYVFEGWSDGSKTFAAGESIIPVSNMTLTAKWQPAKSWITENPTLSIQANADVPTESGASAGILQDMKNDLQSEAQRILLIVLNNTAPDGMDSDQAKELFGLLNAGASSTEVDISAIAKPTGSLTSSHQAIYSEMFAGEQAQAWDLSVFLNITTMDSGNQVIGRADNIHITKTGRKIHFLLSTGEDYTGMDVRVLYLHDGKVKTADSIVVDAQNGIISVYANEFSPYVILSRPKTVSLPQTGDDSHILLWLVLLSISCFGIRIAFKRCHFTA